MVLDLTTTKNDYEAFDGIVIKNYVHGKEGGVVLDFTGFPDDVVFEGHGIIKDGSDFKPQPVDGSQSSLLVGVARSTTLKSHPSSGLMTHGTINSAAAKYPFNAASITALKGLGVHNQED
ncbi:hypothetical protein [Aquimarina sp. 2201CG5-10]|uniref:hypothetical protein n=1 Tax=Aquimarina callyspongiae TaxID=3098150 RepID=UPI002AB44D9A|nr:hypothetical protein [Aquimarina sp. 2201CG5-10]MDY8137567.1 hypothetical protein [Aquimarina sp. 2201CG5-10]